MTIPLDEILENAIVQACADRSGRVRDIQLFKRVIQRLVALAREAEGGSITEADIDLVLQQLEESIVQSGGNNQ